MLQRARTSIDHSEAAGPTAQERNTLARVHEPSHQRTQGLAPQTPWTGNQSHLRRLPIQRKIAIGSVHDPLETEADRAADHVLHSPASQPSTHSAPPALARKCSHCEEAEKKLNTKSVSPAAPSTGEAPAIVHDVLDSPGQPLDSATRSFFEPRFGRDFSGVRIHTGPQAAESARAVNALAYTVEDNVVFADGRFSPGTQEGRHLLAHELTHTIQQRGASTALRRQPADPPKKVQYPPWSQSTPTEALPGDPVPGYETPRTSYTQRDADEMSRLVFERDLENKRNAGAFIGDFGSALISLWGKEVTEAMKQASENSGWSRFQKLLKFVVIKAVEWTLAAGLTPAGAAFFEALEVSISEHVIEKATEAGFGYYMENAAEKREEAAKSSKIERKKESLDKITDQFADLMRTLPNDTLSSLPSGDPYIEWLRLAPLDDLRKFRLPPLFPRVNSSEIRATVAGLIAGLLHVPLKVESAGLCIGLQCAVPDPEKVEYYDDDIIVVREMRDAQIYSPSPAIVKAIAGQVPISQVPLVPLYISNGGPRADAAAAELLLTALRGYGAVSQQEKEDFVKAYAEPGEVTVTRLFGEIEVTGHSLAGDLKLYMVGSGDSRLVDLSREVLTWAHGEAEYRRNIGSAPDEGVSRLADVADLAAKTRFYLEEANDKQRLAWAKALITNEIEKLVPQTPVDRYR